ncbi:MAG: hypothetical protein Q4F74_07640 [Synergistaceae bacterium]|nr:hypothetical protein [Synergistaceae bacterium]
MSIECGGVTKENINEFCSEAHFISDVIVKYCEYEDRYRQYSASPVSNEHLMLSVLSLKTGLETKIQNFIRRYKITSSRESVDYKLFYFDLHDFIAKLETEE